MRHVFNTYCTNVVMLHMAHDVWAGAIERDELIASAPRKPSVSLNFLREASALLFPHILSTVSNNPKVLPLRSGFAFSRADPEKQNCHSNPAARPRRLRSVLELRVRFRPTYFGAYLNKGAS